jgi:uncharacterized protein
MNQRSQDWTQGASRIVYQICNTCRAIWYFHRDFCPGCGAKDALDKIAAGEGTVHAVTLVARAPTAELKSHAPYLIALVDADEGFRMMAHGDKDLKIGERVRARFTTLGDQLVPYFERIPT